ncbi:MAG: GNAT family N-acetyltransferase [Frankiaceae bacterium]
MSPNPADLRLVRLAPDALALIARGGLLPLAAVRGWPHRDTLPLLWTAWQAGGPAWLVTADLATEPGQERDGPAVTRPTSAGLVSAGPPTDGPPHPGVVVVGECAVKGPLSRCAPAEIGYGLAPGARGRGYGRAMVSELVSTLLAAGASEIWAQTGADNVASRRVLEWAGLRLSRASQDATTVCYVLPAEATGETRGGRR